MKYTGILILVIIMGLTSCRNNPDGRISTDVVTNPNSASENTDDNLPEITFEREVFDFGKLIQGEVATYNFRFENTGDADLVISQVNTSCGCTVPQYPKNPIAPGEKGDIKVTFDSSGRMGVQNKTITVASNCQPNKKVIRIKARVINP